MREIVFDTETTGLDPSDGHRLVEIGCIEILNTIPTGQVFHRYINPQRSMPPDAYAVHGLSADFLAAHPLFEHVVAELLAFLGDAKLVAHNAEFDMRFVNAELVRVGAPALGFHRVVDTLALARRRHPGLPNSLDALCQRYRIDNSRRVKHGALLDAEILAEVYAELLGGRQAALILMDDVSALLDPAQTRPARVRPVPLRPIDDADELTAHAAFIAGLGTGAIWNRYAESAAF